MVVVFKSIFGGLENIHQKFKKFYVKQLTTEVKQCILVNVERSWGNIG